MEVHDYLYQEHGYSSRTIRYLIKNGRLEVNGEASRFNRRLEKDDRIRVCFPVERADAEPVRMDIDVVHEDEDLLIVNKSPGMVVHVTRSHLDDTLQNAVYGMWDERGESFKTRFVNRIDMDTSGLVVIAKNKYVHHYIQSQNESGNIRKEYLLICEGRIEKPEGTLDFPIIRERERGLLRVVDPQGKECLTRYSVEEYLGDCTLVRARILTGRTHQIRVHFSHIGHPLLGDSLYNPSSGTDDCIKRQALHAASVSFVHPRKGPVTYTAPLPGDMRDAIKILKKS